jgi:hypothetical protein
MSEAADFHTSSPGPVALSERLDATRNMAITVFVVVGLLVAMSVSQFENIQPGSFRYWVAVGTALLLPFLDLTAIIKTLTGRAVLLLLFLLVGGAWHLFAGHERAVLQLLLLVYVSTWISTDRAVLNAHDIARLYVLLLGIGAAVLLLTDLNIYSLIPDRAMSPSAAGRVSFFPNIAYTGLFSLAAFMVLTKDKALARSHLVVLALAVYFLIFSWVRASLIAAIIYLLLLYWFNRYSEPKPRQMFWTSLFVGVGLNVAIALSARVLYFLQDNYLVSLLFLRGETHISFDRIEYQLYRPWLWKVQLEIFAASPAWMGWGAYDFWQMVSDKSPPVFTAGTESLPLGLMTVYGIPALLFTVYLVVCLRRSARRDDRWACACFPAIFVLMMNWGSSFHPADVVFVLFMLIVARGSEGYVSTRTQSAGNGEEPTTLPLNPIPATDHLNP